MKKGIGKVRKGRKWPNKGEKEIRNRIVKISMRKGDKIDKEGMQKEWNMRERKGEEKKKEVRKKNKTDKRRRQRQ